MTPQTKVLELMSDKRWLDLHLICGLRYDRRFITLWEEHPCLPSTSASLQNLRHVRRVSLSYPERRRTLLSERPYADYPEIRQIKLNS